MNPYALAAPNGILDATTRLSDAFLRYPLEKQAADREARMARLKEQMMGTQIESQGGQLSPDQLAALGVDPSFIRTRQDLETQGTQQTQAERAAAAAREAGLYPAKLDLTQADAELARANADKARRYALTGTPQEHAQLTETYQRMGHNAGFSGQPVPNMDGAPDLDAHAAAHPEIPREFLPVHMNAQLAGYQAFKQQEVENKRKAFAQSPQGLRLAINKEADARRVPAIDPIYKTEMPGGRPMNPDERAAFIQQRLQEEGVDSAAPAADPRQKALGEPPPKGPPPETQTDPATGSRLAAPQTLGAAAPYNAAAPGAKAATIRALLERLAPKP